MAKKTKTSSWRALWVCPRCSKDNIDDPYFVGCARGSCEVEIEGTVETIVKVERKPKK